MDTQRKQLSMKRLYQLMSSYFLSRNGEDIEKLQKEFEIIKGYIDFVWKNKNK